MSTLRAPPNIAADDILIFYFYLSKKIRLDFSCESSAGQRIHLKHQVLFSLKNNEKILMTVICCSHDWPFKVVVVVLLFYVHGKLLRSCRDGQLT